MQGNGIEIVFLPQYVVYRRIVQLSWNNCEKTGDKFDKIRHNGDKDCCKNNGDAAPASPSHYLGGTNLYPTPQTVSMMPCPNSESFFRNALI